MQNEISMQVRKLLGKNFVKENKRVAAMLKDLDSDIQRNFYTVVVLGEFKRGKSTFVNALLGTPLLPMDILPETATINAIMYSEKPRVAVVTETGEETGEPTAEFLKKFSAQSADTEYLNQVRYIKVGYPVDLLKNRIVLVDTPGVYDLSKQRTDITYNFIPKANTVIFVLDANSPLKKTEKDFIDNYLIPLGITDILFLLNKYDEVDEDEDEDLLDEVSRKLTNAFGVGNKNGCPKKFECLPISALDALKGLENGNKNLVEFSGINEVRKKLVEMLDAGRIERKKQATYNARLKFILNRLSRELSNILALKRADSAELQKAVDELEKLIAEQSRNDVKIDEYVAEAKDQFYALTDKSVRFFYNNLSKEIIESIETYSHENFKEYVEITVTKNIKTSFENWIMMYTPAIENFVSMLEKELSDGLSRNFKQRINISTLSGDEVKLEQPPINFYAEDISDVGIKAGAAAAAGTFGLMMFLGIGALPLGFIAIPYLKKKLLTNRLEKSKQMIIPEVKNSLFIATEKLQNDLHKYIDDKCDLTVRHTKFVYDKILADMRSMIQKEIDLKKSAGFNSEQDARKIQSELNELADLINDI